MAQTQAIDVSRWQGDINWSEVTAPIAIIKMSGGDDGLYTDSKAARNYAGARAAGKAVGMYHFAGGKDATNEADFFIAACSPLEENDVMVLDWEVQHPDPVGWCLTFVNRVHDRTGVWPILYLNGSTWNSRDWTPVTNNCGVWVAWYDKDPNGDLPVNGKIYVMHQYTSEGTHPGIAGNVDLNMWYGTVLQFKKYGYHAPTGDISGATPSPVIAPPQPAEPTPTPPPAPVIVQPEPLPEPVPVILPTPTPVSDKSTAVKAAILAAVAALGAALAAVMAWLRS